MIHSELKNKAVSTSSTAKPVCHHEENKQKRRNANPSDAMCSPPLIPFWGEMPKSHLKISGLHKCQQVS